MTGAPTPPPTLPCCLQKEGVRSSGVGEFIHVLQGLGQPDVERIQQLEAFDGGCAGVLPGPPMLRHSGGWLYRAHLSCSPAVACAVPAFERDVGLAERSEAGAGLKNALWQTNLWFGAPKGTRVARRIICFAPGAAPAQTGTQVWYVGGGRCQLRAGLRPARQHVLDSARTSSPHAPSLAGKDCCAMWRSWQGRGSRCKSSLSNARAPSLGARECGSTSLIR